MTSFVEQLKALGEPNRFRIVMMLRIRPLCVCELLEILDVSGATMSNHLKTLRFAGLVESQRDGKWVVYRIKSGMENFIAGLYGQCGDCTQIDGDADRVKLVSRDMCSIKS